MHCAARLMMQSVRLGCRPRASTNCTHTHSIPASKTLAAGYAGGVLLTFLFHVVRPEWLGGGVPARPKLLQHQVDHQDVRHIRMPQRCSADTSHGCEP